MKVEILNSKVSQSGGTRWGVQRKIHEGRHPQSIADGNPSSAARSYGQAA